MHKQTPGSSKSQRTGRVNTRSALPESMLDSSIRSVANATSTNTRTSRHRATMAPSEFSLMERRRMRPLLFPSPARNAQKKNELENKEIELQLLYDEYLQSVMLELIMEKKKETQKNALIARLAAMDKERDSNEEKLLKIKIREQDVVHLSNVQKELDVLIKEANKYKDQEEAYSKIKDILQQMHRILEPLDVLRCENMILPESNEDWQETMEILEKCTTTLKSIRELIGTNSEKYEGVNNALKDFVETQKDIENVRKRLEEALCTLQMLVLKERAFFFDTQNDM